MLKSYRNFLHDDTTLFVEVLEEFSRQRATRSIADTDESHLEMAIELLWFEEIQCVPQLHLVVDPTKAHGAGRSGFVDIFVGNSQRHLDFASYPVLVMELKNVTLRSLWKAQQRGPDVESTSNRDYEPLLQMLHHAREDELLLMKHCYFDKEKRQWHTVQVRDTLQAATAQLNDYMSVISRGQGVLARAGVSDDRVQCRDGGRDILRGYVIICVGGTRVISRRTSEAVTSYSYEVARPQSVPTS